MTIPVDDILRRVGIVLHDEDAVRWTDAERFDWINDAAKAIVVLRPQAGAFTNAAWTLTPGAKQSLPDDAFVLLDIPSNSDGTAISRTSREQLDSMVPGWRAATPKTAIRQYTYDDRYPLEFYVYPPAKADSAVDLVYSRPPAEITASTDDLALESVYLPAVVSYVLHRALAKDSEYASGQLAVMHYQAFQDALGLQNQSTMAVSANQGEA